MIANLYVITMLSLTCMASMLQWVIGAAAGNGAKWFVTRLQRQDGAYIAPSANDERAENKFLPAA